MPKFETLEKYFSPEVYYYEKATKLPNMVDDNFRGFVCTLPCCVSGDYGVDPHHLITKGKVECDFTCVPLARPEHDEFHRIGYDAFEKKYNIDLKDVSISVLIQYCLYKKYQTKDETNELTYDYTDT